MVDPSPQLPAHPPGHLYPDLQDSDAGNRNDDPRLRTQLGHVTSRADELHEISLVMSAS